MALETVDSIWASATIFAWGWDTFVNINTAVLSCESWTTITAIVIEKVLTFTSIGTRFCLTVIYFILTQRSNITWDTLTTELVHHVHASPAMQTWVSLAVIHVSLAVVPSKSDGTDAFKAVDAIYTTGIVFARWWSTFVYLVFTVSATEPWRALAGIAPGGVNAGPTMPAGLILTSLGRCLTMRTMPAFRTLTVVAECPRVLQINHNTILLTPTRTFCILLSKQMFHLPFAT
jgi:hypothetical protein